MRVMDSGETVIGRQRPRHIIPFLDSVGMKDLWRHLNPTEIEFTQEQRGLGGITRSRIDLIYVCPRILSHECSALIYRSQYGISSTHVPISASLGIPLFYQETRVDRFSSYKLLDLRVTQKEQWDEFTQRLSQSNIDSTNLELDELWRVFSEDIQTVANETLSFRTVCLFQKNRITFNREERDTYTIARIIHQLRQQNIRNYSKIIHIVRKIALHYSFEIFLPLTADSLKPLKKYIKKIGEKKNEKMNKIKKFSDALKKELRTSRRT